jgi:hypothetical protein
VKQMYPLILIFYFILFVFPHACTERNQLRACASAVWCERTDCSSTMSRYLLLNNTAGIYHRLMQMTYFLPLRGLVRALWGTLLLRIDFRRCKIWRRRSCLILEVSPWVSCRSPDERQQIKKFEACVMCWSMLSCSCLSDSVYLLVYQ